MNHLVYRAVDPDQLFDGSRLLAELPRWVVPITITSSRTQAGRTSTLAAVMATTLRHSSTGARLDGQSV